MKRLPDTELEVMKALWASGPDTPRAALDHALADFQWSPNTINTYLNRLADKGFVSSPGCTAAPPGTLWPPWPREGWSRRTWRTCGTCWTS